MIVSRSRCANASDNSADCSQQDGCIKEYAPALYVEEVVVKVVMNWQGACAADLPQSGNAREHRQARRSRVTVLFDNERHLRPGTNQAHITFQNVE